MEGSVILHFLKRIPYEKIITVSLPLLILFLLLYPFYINIHVFPRIPSFEPLFETVEKFQVLISGILALIAGSIVWFSTKTTLTYEKKKDTHIRNSYRFLYAKEARMIASHCQINAKLLMKDRKSKIAIKSLDKFRTNFLLNLDHISHFDKNEIWRFSDLENDLRFAKSTYDDLQDYANLFPEKPFKDICDISFYSNYYTNLANTSKKLSKSLDKHRHELWFGR